MDKIHKLLLRAGVPAHMKGYEYIYDAIILIRKDSSYREMMTKRLYPEVGRRNGATGSVVERAMRNAVEAAFDRMPPEIQEELFGNMVSLKKGKATNKEFLAAMELHLRENEE